ESLLEAQRDFLTWLVELAAARSVDAVLVAGDVYDRAVPSTDAVVLLDEALSAFVRAGIPVMLTSGNHDSAIRLGFGSQVQRAAGVHLRTRLSELATPLVLTDDGGQVAVYGIPYLLPDAVMIELAAERSHTGVLSAAVRRIRDDAAERGIERIVVLSHAFVTGGSACESERDIRVGGIADAPADVFAGLCYAALGHLHGAQQVGANARYSGSPLAFSFSERNHVKSVTVIDIDAAGGVSTELVAVPVVRSLREVRGRLTELLELHDPELAEAWVKVVLTDPRRPAAPMERLRARWPHTVVLDFVPDGESVESVTDLLRLAESADPVEICAHFVEWVESTRPDRQHEDVLRSAVEAVRRAELSA
ncbi:MAG: exonuclease SbcCD subunit D, partial [Jatrophihabitantaceae bacterium]